jgi:PhoPQ-activated pathogenicity-related protein
MAYFRRLGASGASMLIFIIAALAPANAGPLEDYVAAPDATYAWKRNEVIEHKGFKVARLEMVSQTWHGQFWSHHLAIIRPKEVTHPDVALLFVTGGGYNGIDEKDLERLGVVAQVSGALVAIVNHVPNQPLYDGRREDALIAYTFAQFLESGDATWPLLFPMAKSAVRALDTVQTFASKEWGQSLTRFVVTGASKRGWTTWLTGAVDPRVVAIAPMVIDMLNMKTQLDWSAKMYGRQSEEINDYTALHLDIRDDEPMRRLRSYVDPYSYRVRYATMPKLLLLGTNDPYWVVDSLRHYWDDLPGPKLVFQTPNAGHDLGGGEAAVKTLASWFALVADGKPTPVVTWNLSDGSKGAPGIEVHADRPVKTARLWTARSGDRDFRDDKWSSRELILSPDGTSAKESVEIPATGFLAFMAEVELAGPGGLPFRLSTRVQVVPDFVDHNP